MNVKVSECESEYLNRLRQKRILLSCYFELTNRCNLNCRHCYIKVEGEKHRQQELSLGEICDLLNQMADAGVIYLNLTGGEPLLRPDFNEIYLFAKKKKFAVAVLTNATLLTQDTVNFFKEYPPFNLKISNYGLSAETYEYITRTRGSFKRFQNAIEMLKKANIRFYIKSIVMRSNYRAILLFKDAISKSGIDCRCVLPFILRRDGNKSKNSVIKKERLRPSEVIGLFSSLKWDFLNERKARLGHRFNTQDCNVGTLMGNITADGKLTICSAICKPNYDLKKISFADAWESIKLKKTLIAQKRIACGDCQHSDYCPWCPGTAYLETGSLEKRVPYLCKVMQALNSNKRMANG